MSDIAHLLADLDHRVQRLSAPVTNHRVASQVHREVRSKLRTGLKNPPRASA